MSIMSRDKYEIEYPDNTGEILVLTKFPLEAKSKIKVRKAVSKHGK